MALLHGSQSYPARPSGLGVQPAGFRATDGVELRGWFVPSSPGRPAVILVPGFKADRAGMIPYARLLHGAGYNVLLYDSRGTGDSGGSFGFGPREVADVRGAAAFLDRWREIRIHRYGVLGVSLGAGVAIVAAAETPHIRAVIADSPYKDQSRFLDGLEHLSLHVVTVPLAPIARWLAEQLSRANFAAFSPRHAARRLGSRSLLLIHARDDHNPTTPLSDALLLRQAASGPVRLWIAPRGGHAGALGAVPGLYGKQVVRFLQTALSG